MSQTTTISLSNSCVCSCGAAWRFPQDPSHLDIWSECPHCGGCCGTIWKRGCTGPEYFVTAHESLSSASYRDDLLIGAVCKACGVETRR